jgi:hypothetical protein
LLIGNDDVRGEVDGLDVDVKDLVIFLFGHLVGVLRGQVSVNASEKQNCNDRPRNDGYDQTKMLCIRTLFRYVVPA